jgi:hypothetical protein
MMTKEELLLQIAIIAIRFSEKQQKLCGAHLSQVHNFASNTLSSNMKMHLLRTYDISVGK